MRDWALILIAVIFVWVVLPVFILAGHIQNVWYWYRRRRLPSCSHFWVYMGRETKLGFWERWRCEHCGEERIE